MKQKINTYVFDTATSTVRLTDFTHVELDRLLIITDATVGTCLYVFADSAPGTATVTGRNQFTLSHSMAGLSNSDALIIYYELDETDPIQDRPIEVKIADTEQEFPVDVRLDGVDARVDSPGVQMVTLAGPGGDVIDVQSGGLLVRDSNAGDLVVGGSAEGVVAGQRVVGSYAEFKVTNPSAVTATTAWFDAAAYRSVSVHCTTATAITWFGSNNRADAVAHGLTTVASVGGSAPALGNASVIGAWAGTLRTRYFRLVLPANSSVVTTFFTEPMDQAGSAAIVSVTPTVDGAANAAGMSTTTQNLIFNGSTWDRLRSVILGTNTVGTGVTAAGMLAQYDNVSPTQITENRFGNLRLSVNRSLHQVIRDGSPWDRERGAQVSERYALLVEDRNADLIDGNQIVQTSPGVQGVGLVGPTGDPIDSIRGALSVYVTNPVVPALGYNSFQGTANAISGTIGNYQGLLLAIRATNFAAGIRFLLLFNDQQIPTAGSIPMLSFPLVAGTAGNPGLCNVGTEFFGDGLYFSQGIAWGISTTDHVFVAGSAADHTVNASYRY